MGCKLKELSKYVNKRKQDGNRKDKHKGSIRRSNNQLTEVPEIQTSQTEWRKLPKN